MPSRDLIRRKPASLEDLRRVPPDWVGQLVAGELFASPRPAAGHAIVTSGLGGELHGPFQRGRGGPGGWYIVDEPELHLGQDVLVPDLAGWKRERITPRPEQGAFEVAPDWVCEVLSPSTAGLDRVKKAHVYARENVRGMWIVDPLVRTLEAYRLGEGRLWVQIGSWAGPERLRAEPFEAIELELAALWDYPEQNGG